jgi:uncharacterized protein (TIGR02265 family)
MRPPPAGFSAYDFSAPLDEVEVLRTLRPAAVKGIAMRGLLKEAEAQGRPLPGARSYLPFKAYPFRESVDLVLRMARHLHPNLPLREAMRRLGQRVYGGFLDSMLGRAMFGIPGMRLESLIKLIPKTYGILLSECESEVKLVSSTSDSALFSFRSFPIRVDSYEIGVFEGGFLARNKKAEVRLKQLGVGDAELFCTWEGE